MQDSRPFKSAVDGNQMVCSNNELLNKFEMSEQTRMHPFRLPDNSSTKTKMSSCVLHERDAYELSG